MDDVIVIDNGYVKHWDKREFALGFYTMMAYTLSEDMKRYMQIIASIVSGSEICCDGTTDSVVKRRTQYGER